MFARFWAEIAKAKADLQLNVAASELIAKASVKLVAKESRYVADNEAH